MTSKSTLSSTWTKLTGALQDILSPEVYNRWVPQLSLWEDNGKTMTLVSENAMATLWLESSYISEFQQAAMLCLGEKRNFKFITPEEINGMNKTEEPAPAPKPQPAKQKAAPKTITPEPAIALATAANNALNTTYTFDTFIEYDDSRFAYKACLSLVESERPLFNPLFIYGKAGCGKTHLLQSIGHELKKRKAVAKVVYVTGEQFANEFIEASRAQNNQNFAKLRRKYRKADVLLVDDIQFIAGKEKTEEEFLHTFEALFHAHKTIVFCADAAACDIPGLNKRLADRLESGLTVELNLPDDEARLEILRGKRDQADMNVSDEVLKFLAGRIQKNVRRLEAALLRVATFTSLSGNMPSIDKIEHLLRDILREENSRILSVDTIQKKVADFYELKVSDLTGKKRPNSIAFPRQVAMYLSRRLTECSLKDIGQAFGGRDHGTVIHANKLVASRIETDLRVRDIVNRLEEELKA